MILDTETTGLPITRGFNDYYDPKHFLHCYDNSRMIELGYNIYDNNDQIYEYSNIIKPDNFTITNSNIHKISHPYATYKGLLINTVLKHLQKNIKYIDVIVGHNIMFDIHILLSECYRYNFHQLAEEILKKNIVCTMKLGKQYLNLNRYPKLQDLYTTLFNTHIVQNHRATGDVELCAKCYFYMIKKN